MPANFGSRRGGLSVQDSSGPQAYIDAPGDNTPRSSCSPSSARSNLQTVGLNPQNRYATFAASSPILAADRALIVEHEAVASGISRKGARSGHVSSLSGGIFKEGTPSCGSSMMGGARSGSTAESSKALYDQDLQALGVYRKGAFRPRDSSLSKQLMQPDVCPGPGTVADQRALGVAGEGRKPTTLNILQRDSECWAPWSRRSWDASVGSAPPPCTILRHSRSRPMQLPGGSSMGGLIPGAGMMETDDSPCCRSVNRETPSSRTCPTSSPVSCSSQGSEQETPSEMDLREFRFGPRRRRAYSLDVFRGSLTRGTPSSGGGQRGAAVAQLCGVKAQPGRRSIGGCPDEGNSKSPVAGSTKGSAADKLARRISKKVAALEALSTCGPSSTSSLHSSSCTSTRTWQSGLGSGVGPNTSARRHRRASDFDVRKISTPARGSPSRTEPSQKSSRNSRRRHFNGYTSVEVSADTKTPKTAECGSQPEVQGRGHDSARHLGELNSGTRGDNWFALPSKGRNAFPPNVPPWNMQPVRPSSNTEDYQPSSPPRSLSPVAGFSTRW